MDNETVNFTNLCEEAKIVSNTWQLKTILLLECMVGILAIFPNVLAMILLYRVKVFHVNLRVLLAHLSFDLTFYSVAMAEKAFRRLLTPVCRYPTRTKTCVLQEWALQFPLHNAMLALVVLLLERVYCTLRFRTYDRAGRRPYLAVLLLICTWICTFGIEISNYINTQPKLWTSYCEITTSAHANVSLTIITTFMSLEIVSIAIMICVYFYNRYLLNHMAINRAQFDLSSRFQVDQNVKLNAALLPADILHIISYLPSYTSLTMTFIPGWQLAVETKVWFLHMTYLWRMIYAFVHPTMLIALNPNLRQNLQKTAVGKAICACRGTKISAVNSNSANEKADFHFEHLTKMWADSAQKHMKN